MNIWRKNLVLLSIAAMLAVSLLTYFVKPKPTNLEFVQPAQELPNYKVQYPGDTKLSDRVLKSYDLAMILVQTPYIQKNYHALESIRRWAREHFSESPDFLHPTVLPTDRVNHDTVFGALGHNAFSLARDTARAVVARGVTARIQDFHGTYPYQTFRTAYFDLFGWDSESAVLLARYQNERAKVAVDVVLWAITWIIFAIGSVVYLWRNRRGGYFAALQRVLACTWALVALSYFIQTWATEQASSAISFLGTALMSAYCMWPMAVISHAEASPRLIRVHVAPRWIAFAAWLTITLLIIQVLTWIRHSMPGSDDPVTMIVAAVRGNFVHDSVHGKRTMCGILGLMWLTVSVWAFAQRNKTHDADLNSERELARLDAVQFAGAFRDH